MTDKDRLKNAKLMAEMLRVETRLPHDFPFDLVDWLIEQAEQKQSLETAVDFYQSALRDADKRVQELEEEIKTHAPHGRNYTNEQYIELLNENKRYREALEFYADEENYKPFDGISLSSYQNKIDEDGGQTARRALEGESE